MLKSLTLWMRTNCGKFFKWWEYQTTLPASWETCMQDKNQQLELDMEQWTGSKLGKSMSRLVLSPCLFNLYEVYIMQNIELDEAQAGIKNAGKNIKNLLCRWHHPYGRKQRATKEPLDERERGEKAGLKLNIQKTKIMVSSPTTSWPVWGNNENSDRLYFLGLQNHCRWWLRQWN